MFWSLIARKFPKLGTSASDLASNAWAWFVLVVLLIIFSKVGPATIEKYLLQQPKVAIPPVASASPSSTSSATLECASVSDVPTRLRLQFNGGNTMPTGIEQKNIWRWYALTTVVSGLNPKTHKIQEGGRDWILFMIFDKPVNYNEVHVDANGGNLPLYDVKDSTAREAIVVFNGPLAGVIINVQFVS